MTTSTPARAARLSVLGLVGSAVDKHITGLQRGYLDDRSDAVATLARLRRGVGKPAGETADLWGLTGAETLYEAYTKRVLTEEGMGQAEEAVHATVTLWALHQQSQRAVRMHRRDGTELGLAVRRLGGGGEIDEPLRKRFVRVGTASTPAVLAGRLRDIVLLLRREAIPLDYGLLADQLYRWQQPGGPQEIRRAWGRSYLAVPRKQSAETPGPVEGADTHPEDDDSDPTTPEDTL